MGETIAAAGLVILTREPPQQLLLLQHRDRWDLPKGHVDAGEDLVTTALRETEEETGLAADQITIDPTFRFEIEYQVRGTKRGDYRKRVTYFLGYIDQAVPVRVTEHIGYRWLNWPTDQSIQSQTIDPLLNQLKRHLQSPTTDVL